MISAEGFLEVITELTKTVGTEQLSHVNAAADVIAGCVRAGGVVQAFGCGHSEALAMEIAGRAGGLVPSNRISLRDLVLFGGEEVSVLEGPLLEKDPTVARRLYELAPVGAEDVFVIASNSGVNGLIVEFALHVKSKGHKVIALTSRQHTDLVESNHPSGRKLAELADVVLDNGAPYGDSTIALPGGGAVGAVSSITAALLAQQITVEVVRRLLDDGGDLPIYLSANIPGGREHNKVIEDRYSGRIRRTA
ncbi:sugar isomerase domain-containing protein [Allokutzneria multivorans]|uniref:Sugar isomerase domain-containing protein n=1 Tax=Allokutzneria multivorans TaxID=1142134 RepID=A0ABP7QQ25_9PSEU